jgi:ketosteroid isomerase-like protein
MKTASDLLRENLLYMTTDFARWRDLFAENAVWEFPYGASVGVSSPVRGIDGIAKSVEGFLASVEDFRFSDPKIHAIQDDEAVFAEFAGHGKVFSTGRIYHQNYAVFVRATDGKISLVREYFDTVRIAAAFSK